MHKRQKAVAGARDVTRSLDDAVKAFQVCAAACHPSQFEGNEHRTILKLRHQQYPNIEYRYYC